MLVATTIATVVLSLFVGNPFVYSTGNGAPSGPHFNLNLIGAKATNCPQTDSSGGSRIFVPLVGKSR